MPDKIYRLNTENVHIGMAPTFIRHSIYPTDTFYWETEDIENENPAAESIGTDFELYKANMRGFFIIPSQLRNTGITNLGGAGNPLDDKHFDELCRYLARPHIVLSAVANEIPQILSYPIECALVYDTVVLESGVLSLNSIVRVFKRHEINLDDILFNENPGQQIPESFRENIRKRILDYS